MIHWVSTERKILYWRCSNQRAKIFTPLKLSVALKNLAGKIYPIVVIINYRWGQLLILCLRHIHGKGHTDDKHKGKQNKKIPDWKKMNRVFEKITLFKASFCFDGIQGNSELSLFDIAGLL